MVKKTIATACKQNVQPISWLISRPRWPNSRPRCPIPQEAASSQKHSHRNSVQNGPIEKFTALRATIFVTISVFMSRGNFSTPIPKTSSSQSCSHRISVQNGPVDKFTALTGTTFVTISVFMSRGQKLTPIPKNVVVTKTFAPKFCAEWSGR